MSEKIVKTLTVATKGLPVELKQRHENSEDGFWLYASREVVDSEGDIIRIDGMDLSKYHDPANGTHLKILAQHLRVLPNGMSPVVAVVKDYVKTTVGYKGKLVKALALWCEWLKTEEGKLLPLSKHYREMVESGGIDSGSVGIIIDEYQKLEETGGLDITKSSMFECSLVTIPANGSATMVRQKLADLGYELEDEQQEEEARDDTWVVSMKDANGQVRQYVEKTAHDRIVSEVLEKATTPHTPASEVETLCAALREQVSPLAKTLGDVESLVKGLADRLDTLESAVVVLTQSRQSQGEGDRDTETEKSLELVKSQLDDLLKYISK
jgi:hypothetical protein